LRAGAQREEASNPGLSRFSLTEPERASSEDLLNLNAGLNLRVRDGLLFSTQVENLSADDNTPGWTRFSGGIGLSTWQNRLSLGANLSRLNPENVNESAVTAAGVNIGLDVSQRLSLSLLYQQLFSTPVPQRAERVVAGGVSIKF
jgi:hypothetical protein